MFKTIVSFHRCTILDAPAIVFKLDDGVNLIVRDSYEISYSPNNKNTLQGLLDAFGVVSVHQLQGQILNAKYLKKPHQRETIANGLVLSEIEYKAVKVVESEEDYNPEDDL
ncbi:hypothetical protein NMN79_004466 [Salmonella enterica]|nr:hypothetical protein [Salmonella enterica]